MERVQVHAGQRPAETYLTELCRVDEQNGWEKKAYAYIVDEPDGAAGERKAEKYARVLHRASAKSGFRSASATDEPRPKSLGGIKTANAFLFDDVDIWVPRYIYFFGRVPALRDRQRHGDEIWWYTYANHFIGGPPTT